MFLVFTAISLTMFTGCGGGDKSESPSSSQTTTAPIRIADDQQCEKLIDNAFIALDPENLGISSDRDTGVSLLNQWSTVCGDSATAENDSEQKIDETLKKLLSPEELELIVNPHYLQRDADHIRNAIWCDDIVANVTELHSDEMARVLELFSFAIQQLALVEAETDVIPQSLFDVCLLGRGTAEDRAWLFANLLRPLQYDTVILKPGGSESTDESPDQKPGYWLVGVLMEGKVLLFDTHLGLPIPGEQDDSNKPFITQPATLSQVFENEEVLTQLDIEDHTYPLTSTDLKNGSIELIGDTSFWSRRMLKLQMSLAGDRAVTISDGLEDNEFRKGLLTRVTEAGKKSWTKENISVWPYPEKRLVAAENLEFEQREALVKQKLSFSAPVPIIEIGVNEQQMMELKYGQARQLHLKARNSQLRGETGDSIRTYLSIRLWGGYPPYRTVVPGQQSDPGQPMQQSSNKFIYVNLLDHAPPQWREIIANRIDNEKIFIHQTAAEQAFFWVGSCQMEQQNFTAAAASLGDYLKRHPDGAWNESAYYLQAISLARKGNLEEAIQALEKSSVESPQHHGNSLLIRRWKSQLEKEETPAETSVKE